MRKYILQTVGLENAQKTSIGFLVAAGLVLLSGNTSAQDINLNSAGNFAVLAGSTVTSTGATLINGGDVGVFPGSSTTGFPPGIIAAPYTMQIANGPAHQGEADLTTAYNTAAGLAPTESLTGQNLGGLILTPGVYFYSSSAQLTGTLTLNDEGNPNAVFVFQIGSTLTTASDSAVVSINTDGSLTSGIDVFWQVGTSATLGTGSAVEGNIMALASITANTGASDVDGRLLAINGAVILDDNLITVLPAEGSASAPENFSTLLLLGGAVAALLAFGRWSALLLLRTRKLCPPPEISFK